MLTPSRSSAVSGNVPSVSLPRSSVEAVIGNVGDCTCVLNTPVRNIFISLWLISFYTS